MDCCSVTSSMMAVKQGVISCFSTASISTYFCWLTWLTKLQSNRLGFYREFRCIHVMVLLRATKRWKDKIFMIRRTELTESCILCSIQTMLFPAKLILSYNGYIFIEFQGHFNQDVHIHYVCIYIYIYIFNLRWFRLLFYLLCHKAFHGTTPIVWEYHNCATVIECKTTTW